MDGEVRVRYFAGARAAAGVSEEAVPAAGRPLTALLALLAERHGDRLGAVLAAASFLVDGVACRERDRKLLPAGAVVDVLPPFAGG